MVQLLPTSELADLSQRAQITYEKASEGSLAWSQLLTLVSPKIFGTAGAVGYQYYGPGTYWYYWETCIYLGILPLLLAALSITQTRRERPVVFFWVVAILVLLYALGGNFFLHKLFYDYAPGFSKFRNPARAGIFLSFAAAILSGFSFQYLLYGQQSPAERRRLNAIAGGVLGAGILVWILTVSGSLEGSYGFMKNPRLMDSVKSDANISALFLILSSLLLFALINKRERFRSAPWLIVVVLFLDMLIFGGNQNNARLDPSAYYRQPESVIRYLKNAGESDIFRVNTRSPQGMVMDRNLGMIDRIFMMEGYTPLALQRAYAPYAKTEELFDLLNVRYKTVYNEQTHALTLVENPTYLPRAFFLYQFHVSHTEDELVAYIQSNAFQYRTIAALEKDPGYAPPPPARLPTWQARITHYENDRIALDVRTSDDGLLVLSEIFYPGWKAFVDRKETEVLRTDYNLRGLFVPGGEHAVEVVFAPPTFITGGIVTVCACLLCIGGGGISLVRSWKDRR
jgi:hypothetical protein